MIHTQSFDISWVLINNTSGDYDRHWILRGGGKKWEYKNKYRSKCKSGKFNTATIQKNKTKQGTRLCVLRYDTKLILARWYIIFVIGVGWYTYCTVWSALVSRRSRLSRCVWAITAVWGYCKYKPECIFAVQIKSMKSFFPDESERFVQRQRCKIVILGLQHNLLRSDW